jgi:hypothetical protein
MLPMVLLIAFALLGRHMSGSPSTLILSILIGVFVRHRNSYIDFTTYAATLPPAALSAAFAVPKS